MLIPLVIGQRQEEGDQRRQLFAQKPCPRMYNQFSGKLVDCHFGSHGYKGVYTCASGCLQGSLKQHYHHLKGVDVAPHSRAARFVNPIMVTKDVTGDSSSGQESYFVAHVSFQSTGGTNIATVNALDRISLAMMSNMSKFLLADDVLGTKMIVS